MSLELCSGFQKIFQKSWFSQSPTNFVQAKSLLEHSGTFESVFHLILNSRESRIQMAAGPNEKLGPPTASVVCRTGVKPWTRFPPVEFVECNEIGILHLWCFKTCFKSDFLIIQKNFSSFLRIFEKSLCVDLYNIFLSGNNFEVFEFLLIKFCLENRQYTN